MARSGKKRRASAPAQVGLFDADIELHFPRQVEISSRINGNLIQKLVFNDRIALCKVASFSHNRSEGFMARDVRGRATFIVARPTNANVPCDDMLLVEGVKDVAAIAEVLKRGSSRWLRPKHADPAAEEVGVGERRCAEIVESWKGQFQFRQEYEKANGEISPGLRAPQIGALHATLAHWSVTNAPATIVMPTGTGKTETMLALLANVGLERLMVVVPNSALREQIAGKFLTLGILQRAGCVSPSARLPVVASLMHIPKTFQEVEEIFRRANVIVSTMQIAGKCTPEIQSRMAELCSHLFIDEAHHIGAKTWAAFKEQFSSKPILQFTATPFRTDGRRVDGKFIYNYPLAKAQKEDYFRPINFLAVHEYEREDADRKIAQRAIGRLTADLRAGHDHVLMARVDEISRVTDVLRIYQEEGAKFQPIAIHSEIPTRERKTLLDRLRSRQSRIVVCVDMFGEGFDFPELKVAALHDRHQSLAITLQFIGRFTRSSTTIGEASVVANIADEGISKSLRNLYAEDADWDHLLRMLSEGATDRARKRHELLAGFTSSLPEIPLQTLFPRMSAVVYRTACDEWQPLNIEEVIQGAQLYAGPVINPEHRLAIFVTRDEDSVQWSSVKQIQDVTWNLYVMHWNEELNLLFISSSNKDFHEKLAQAVAGTTDRIVGETVFRALGNIRRLVLTNLGLSHAFGKNIRYTKFMGADIAEGLSEAQRLSRRKSDLFGMGYENDEKVTVGGSFKGRLWSYKVAYDLADWVDWCAHIGKKLLNESIDTAQIFEHVIKARRLSARPPLVPVMVSWPEGFQDQPEHLIKIEIGGADAPFFECDVEVTSHSDEGPLSFDVVAGASRASFQVDVTEAAATFRQSSGQVAYASVRGRRLPLADWFNSDPPIIHFANGDFLVFNELFELPRGGERRTFEPSKITAWDWEGVDIRKESQGEQKDPASIQRRVIERVVAGEFGNFDVVFDDDGSGEVADVVAIGRGDRRAIVHLFHCKYSSGDAPGARIDDFYAVCGQAQKCVRWREDPRRLLKRLNEREAIRTRSGRASRFERGDRRLVQQILNAAKELSFDFHVHIVQPGLSKQRLTTAHLDVLGATETFLAETYSMPLRVIASA